MMFCTYVQLYKVLLPVIEEHKKSLDPYEYRDFVDAYLLEIEKNRGESHSFYTGMLSSCKRPSLSLFA